MSESENEIDNNDNYNEDQDQDQDQDQVNNEDNEPNEPIKLDYVVYLLVNTSNNKTYVGSTNNTKRRIRQHNGDLVGGAKYTKINKDTGKWLFYGMIKNLHKRQALSIEKKIQIRSRKLSGTPIERRLKAFNSILNEYNQLNNTNLFFEKI